MAVIVKMGHITNFLHPCSPQWMREAIGGLVQVQVYLLCPFQGLPTPKFPPAPFHAPWVSTSLLPTPIGSVTVSLDTSPDASLDARHVPGMLEGIQGNVWRFPKAPNQDQWGQALWSNHRRSDRWVAGWTRDRRGIVAAGKPRGFRSRRNKNAAGHLRGGRTVSSP